MTEIRGKVFILLLFFSKNFETGKLYTEIVQKRLNEAGITDEEGKPLLEDGIYGEKTKKAHEKAIKIKQFEDENSGVVKNKTGESFGWEELTSNKMDEKFGTRAPNGAGENNNIVPATTDEWTSFMDFSTDLPWMQILMKNPESKKNQRLFWGYASRFFLERDSLSYKMLIHSLQDTPADFTENLFPEIGEIICKDDSFNKRIEEIAENNSDSQALNYTINTFNFKNDDLSKSIHGVDKIKVSGNKNTRGEWELTINVTDMYDYTTFKSLGEFVGKSIGEQFPLAANNLAYLSQKSGAIQPYKVNFTFKCKLKDGKLVPVTPTLLNGDSNRQ